MHEASDAARDQSQDDGCWPCRCHVFGEETTTNKGKATDPDAGAHKFRTGYTFILETNLDPCWVGEQRCHLHSPRHRSALTG